MRPLFVPLGTFANTAASAVAGSETLLQAHVSAGSDMGRLLIAMHPSTCLTFSLMQNTNGNKTFPELGARGGFIDGIPVATSVSCIRSGSPTEKVVAAIGGAKILVADDNLILVDASDVATLQMDDSPTQTAEATPTPTSVVSMMQSHSVAIKLIRFLNFQRAAASAVAWMTSTF